MKNKAAESECYEEYGIRCGLSVYRRFGTLLSQNLRKGSKGLSELLKRETGEMFEERKKQARKREDNFIRISTISFFQQDSQISYSAYHLTPVYGEFELNF